MTPPGIGEPFGPPLADTVGYACSSGINSAPEEFQRCLDEPLEGLVNIADIHDDIVIFGSGDSIEVATFSHGLAFRAILDRWSVDLSSTR